MKESVPWKNHGYNLLLLSKKRLSRLLITQTVDPKQQQGRIISCATYKRSAIKVLKGTICQKNIVHPMCVNCIRILLRDWLCLWRKLQKMTCWPFGVTTLWLTGFPGNLVFSVLNLDTKLHHGFGKGNLEIAPHNYKSLYRVLVNIRQRVYLKPHIRNFQPIIIFCAL